VKPSSTKSRAPLTKLDSSLARNSTARAASSGLPIRPCAAMMTVSAVPPTARIA
jgi:hypothetical protein